jgi:beta-xylosidase
MLVKAEQHIYKSCSRLARHAWRLARSKQITTPSLMRARQPSLLLAEPSLGHNSFLQQHHFQGNIQQIF